MATNIKPAPFPTKPVQGPPKPVHAPTEKLAPNIDIKSIRVMIIDDHDPIRKAMRTVLSRMGIRQFTECFDGFEAGKALARAQVDLILCDLYMKRVNGFELLTQIRSRAVGSDIPFIVVTGEATRENIVKASAIGADEYVIKPFHAEQLEQKVIAVLNQFFNPPPILRALRSGDRNLLEGNIKVAFEAYKEAATIDPSSARVGYSIGLALEKMQRVDEAIIVLQQNITKNPSFYRNHQALANIYMKNGDKKKTIEYMKQELDLNPKQIERQVEMAKLLIAENDHVNAILHYKEAIKENAKDPNALLGVAQSLAATEDVEKAFFYLKRMRRHHPMDTRPLASMVSIAIKAKNPKIAEVALKEEKNGHPERKDTYVQIARLCLHESRPDDAWVNIQQVLELDPNYVEALRVKGGLECDKKDYQNAIITFKKVAKLDPSAASFSALARPYTALGALKEGIESLHQSLAVDAKHAPAFQGLSTAYFKSKQFAKAYFSLERAIRLSNDFKPAEQSKKLQAQIKLRRETP